MSPKPIFSNIINSDPLSDSSSVENAFCPYVGLKSFENNGSDSHFFFGRDTLTHQLLNHLQKHNFLALVGALGNGKSSLLQAGLLHHLSSSQEWEIKLMQPGQHPLKTLAMTFADNSLPPLQKAEQVAEIQIGLEQSPENFSHFLDRVSTPKLFLAIDHFEEIFTLCQNSKERWQFLSCLLTALEQHPHKFTMIAIINEEFLGYCLEQKPRKLGQKIQENLIFISPLNYQERYDAITLPAQQANLELESQLVEKLLKDSQNLPGSLSLLQYALWQICRFRSNFKLTLSSYKQLGEVRKVLDRQATQIFHQLNRIQQRTAKKLFLSLIQTHEEMGHICYRVPQRKLENLPNFYYVLQQFKEAGLIKVEERDSFSKKETFLQLSHPIIIQHWPLLQQWLEQRQYCLREQKNLTETAQKWQTSDRDNQYLLSSEGLKIVKTLQRNQINFSPLTKEFINQSSKQKSRNTLLYALLPITLITVLGGLTYRHWEIKTAQKTLELVKNNPYDIRRKDALEKLNFWQINLQNIPLASTYLKDLNLPETNLSNMDFSGANLENANLSKSDLINSNFKTANLTNSRLVKSNLSQSNLRLTNLIQGNLSEANLFQTNFTFASLNFANLSSTNLSQSSLYFADLEGANLLKTNMSRSNLSGANLAFSNLMFANLSNANLSSANLVEANFLSADLTNTNLLGANLIQSKNLEPTHLKKACFWQYAIYKGKWNSQQQEWEIDEMANRQFIEQLIEDKTSDPAVEPTC
ncbi:MAG: pentapeptide repeat-containing protein [Crocosphaera sp.]|nr:pentapeptide repeat-containing protein [Crocosphaera sp.]